MALETLQISSLTVQAPCLHPCLLQEFFDHIEVSHAERASKTGEITIVYNFIGAFDFDQAKTKDSKTNERQKRHGRSAIPSPYFNVSLTHAPFAGCA